jgi:tetratricopeptide (TPR) repeat protein
MEAIKNEGNELFKLKNYQGAIEKYKEALELIDDNDTEKDKKKSILNSNISATYCKEENFELALEHAVMSTRLNSEWHKAWYRLSFVLYKLGKINEAKKSIEKTIECCKEENINEKYIIDLKTLINQTEEDNSDYNILDENDEKMPKMPNMPNMANMGDNFMPLMNQMMNNSKIKEKLENPEFREKMLKNQSNPLSMLTDPDMKDIMTEMMKSMSVNK